MSPINILIFFVNVKNVAQSIMLKVKWELSTKMDPQLESLCGSVMDLKIKDEMDSPPIPNPYPSPLLSPRESASIALI
ncbi:Growth factor receptor-bound protein 14, partial [Bienertia sinuspersici]